MDWNSIARTERNSLSFRQLVHPGCQNTLSGIASMVGSPLSMGGRFRRVRWHVNAAAGRDDWSALMRQLTAPRMASTAAPYRCSFDAPTPLICPNSSMLAGRTAAMSRNTESWKIT